MDIKLTCVQVAALISYYIEGKLAPSLVEYVHQHLENCQNCKTKYEELKQVLSKYTQMKENSHSKEVNSEMIKNLSAYIDNELNSDENIKVKKMTISNPTARKNLEVMYKYQKLLLSAYTKTKNDYKFDYSKNIISMINQSPDYNTTYFRNIIILSIFLIIAILCGFAYLYL